MYGRSAFSFPTVRRGASLSARRSDENAIVNAARNDAVDDTKTRSGPAQDMERRALGIDSRRESCPRLRHTKQQPNGSRSPAKVDCAGSRRDVVTCAARNLSGSVAALTRICRYTELTENEYGDLWA